MQVIDHLSKQQQFEILGKVAFFQRFSKDELKILLAHGPELVAYRDQEWVLMEGDQEDKSLYVVLNGSLTVFAGKTPVAEMGAGQCFGEMAFLTGSPRTGSIRADSKTVLFRLERRSMNRLPVTAREKIKDNLITLLIRRVRHSGNGSPTPATPDGKDPWATDD